jgi:DNA-directed RNA polymerase specialized sigma24 family protein
VTSGPGTAASLEHLSLLLAKLDPHNEASAGQSYEALRRRLTLYFRLRLPHEAEELTDRVLDRVARRIADGVEIDSVSSYSAGVAKWVLRERYASTRREERAWADLGYAQQVQTGAPIETDDSAQAARTALRQCLDGMLAIERRLILEYYGADGPARKRARQGLAQRLSISINALHNRALRLRKQLERCVAARCGGIAST